MGVLQILFLTILSAASVAAQDYCSLIVQVVDPAGNKIRSSVWVTAQEGGGRVAFASTEDGEARLCDLGVKGATITVGSLGACQSVVRNIPLLWGITNRVKILYDLGPCSMESSPPMPTIACSVLLRFMDTDGKWIPDVVLEPSRDVRSDRYGRAMLTLANEESLHARSRKEGFLPEAIDLTCLRGLLDPERVVALRRSPLKSDQ